MPRQDLPYNRYLEQYVSSDFWRALVYNETRKLRVYLDSEKREAYLKSESKFGYTPLTWACTFGYTEVVKLLIEAGADLNGIGDNKRTAFTECCTHNHIKILRLLLPHISKINVNYREHCYTSLLISLIQDMKHRMLYTLIDNEVPLDIDVITPRTTTPYIINRNPVSKIQTRLIDINPHINGRYAIIVS